MSEAKHVSPLLDGLVLGTAMSDHDGVACIPAMKENSDDKYIIKVISIPASQVQLDALLLAGAYKDAASAMDYFSELADGIVKEAECLKKLARLEGFLPFDRWQVVPMEQNQLGYQVYLVGSYKRSLEKFMRRNQMTHLSAVNLGLDMCAALSVARQAGWIYVDLKPSNIFISEDREYRIGDLGFMALDSLKYSALPSKYHSPYNAPELKDALSTPNETVDTYAAGMILYQIYNNGVLPTVAHPTEEALPAPANADYEMAEIILKACAPDPKDRWADPVEMGQALVAYMQRNSVNDTPITPPQVTLDGGSTGIEKKRTDETIPSWEDAGEIDPAKLSKETHSMLSRADDLISHEVLGEDTKGESGTATAVADTAEDTQAEDVVPPEKPKDTLDEDTFYDNDRNYKPGSNSISDTLTDSTMGRIRKLIAPVLSVLLLLLLAGGAFLFYTKYYLISVNEITVEGIGNEMTVTVDTAADPALLTVICTDTYGNTKSASLENGKVVFDELLPDMLYKVRLEVEGFHKLSGAVTHEYTTPLQTNIVSLTAVTGPEDGSVILSFTIDGPDSDEWKVSYTASDLEMKTTTFSGHSVTITGLNLGKTYTFHLDSVPDKDIQGEDTIVFTPSRIIFAQNLRVSEVTDGTMTVKWDVPEDTYVSEWSVHCYSSSGYDKLITTKEPKVTFEGIDSSSAYTIEVTAAGMTQSVRTNLTANYVNITDASVSIGDPEQLTVEWEYEGNAPLGGWHLIYSIDGSSRQEIVQTDTTSAVIPLRIPGAEYTLSIEAADGSSVFGNDFSFTCPNAQVYENPDYGIFARHIEKMMDVHLLATPGKPDWSYKNVTHADYTTTFTAGQNISVLLYLQVNFYVPRDNTSILYVIRDSEGKVISELVSRQERIWYDMWWNDNYHYCELDIPAVPTTAGDYTLYIYFDGMAITSADFTITE